MLKLSQPITSINGFKIGDRVRLKDGDGRPHIIKSFSIDGIKEFFFEVQFEDGADTMLDNIALLPSNLDDAAEKNFETMEVLEHENIFEETHRKIFKAGAEWMAGQGVNADFEVCKLADRAWLTPIDEYKRFMQDVFDNFAAGDKVVVQIRKK